MNIRKASKHDARALAILINQAGEGIPEYLWQNMADSNESALDVGTARAARDEGGFSYKNAMVCTQFDEILGMILAYKQSESYEAVDLSEFPDFIRPLIVLEAQAPGSWYVNALATFEPHQGKGVARMLLADAEKQASKSDCDSLSLIVASENENANRLYKHLGFSEVSRETVTPCPGLLHAGDWILLTKQIFRQQA